MNIFKNLTLVGMLSLSTACATASPSLQNSYKGSEFGESCNENLETTMRVSLPSGLFVGVPEIFCRNSSNATVSLSGSPFLKDPKWYVASLTNIFGTEYIENIRTTDDSVRTTQRMLLAQYSDGVRVRGQKGNKVATAAVAGLVIGLLLNNNRRDHHDRFDNRRNRRHHVDSRTREINRYLRCRSNHSVGYCNRNQH